MGEAAQCLLALSGRSVSVDLEEQDDREQAGAILVAEFLLLIRSALKGK